MDSRSRDGFIVEGGVRLVLVPRTPGPLVPADLVLGRPRDDLDELIDDVFGQPAQERPGALDVALVVVGALLIGWTVLGASPLAAAVGIALVILGLALPGREALRSLRARRTDRRLEDVRARGMLLDVEHPATRRLVDAYGRLLTVAGRVDGSVRDPAVMAGHLALTETASLLLGRPPRIAAEVDYVDRRTAALRSLAQAISATSEHVAATAAVERNEAEQDDALRAEMLVAAREELDTLGGLGSLEQIAALDGRLRGEPS